MRLTIALLLIASPVWAGSYAITTNAKQDAILADVAADAGVTIQAYLNGVVSEQVKADYSVIIGRKVGAALTNQWDTLTNTQRNNICTALGVAACPP